MNRREASTRGVFRGFRLSADDASAKYFSQFPAWYLFSPSLPVNKQLKAQTNGCQGKPSEVDRVRLSDSSSFEITEGKKGGGAALKW